MSTCIGDLIYGKRQEEKLYPSYLLFGNKFKKRGRKYKFGLRQQRSRNTNNPEDPKTNPDKEEDFKDLARTNRFRFWKKRAKPQREVAETKKLAETETKRVNMKDSREDNEVCVQTPFNIKPNKQGKRVQKQVVKIIGAKEAHKVNPLKIKAQGLVGTRELTINSG